MEFEEAKQQFLDENPELAEDPQVAAQFMTFILLFGAATVGATRNEKRALYDIRLRLKQGESLSELAKEVFEVKGPEWEVPDATMEAIHALHQTED